MLNPESTQTHLAAEEERQILRERISELEEQVANLARLEDTIYRNNRLFEGLLTCSQDGIALTRPDGSVIRVVKSILGYGPSLVCGFSVFDLIHPDDQQIMRACYRRILEEGVRQVKHEVRLMKPDGSLVWIEGTVTDMLDNPNVLAVVHNYRDVTARKEATAALQELATVMEQVPLSFFSKDLDGSIRSWNGGAERAFGYTSNEIVGQHVRKLVPAELQDEEQALRLRVVQEQCCVGPYRTSRVHKNGERIPIDLTLAPLVYEGGVRGVVHMSRMDC